MDNERLRKKCDEEVGHIVAILKDAKMAVLKDAERSGLEDGTLLGGLHARAQVIYKKDPELAIRTAIANIMYREENGEPYDSFAQTAPTEIAAAVVTELRIMRETGWHPDKEGHSPDRRAVG